MTIATFCRRYQLPERRVHRLIKKEVETNGEPMPIEGEWLVDLSEEIGVVARQPSAGSRLSYSVEDDRKLRQWIGRAIGVDLLFPEEVEYLLVAARFAHDVATGAHEDYSIYTKSEKEAFKPNAEYFERLQYALRKMGK